MSPKLTVLFENTGKVPAKPSDFKRETSPCPRQQETSGATKLLEFIFKLSVSSPPLLSHLSWASLLKRKEKTKQRKQNCPRFNSHQFSQRNDNPSSHHTIFRSVIKTSRVTGIPLGSMRSFSG